MSAIYSTRAAPAPDGLGARAVGAGDADAGKATAPLMATPQWDADEAVTRLYAAHYTSLVRLAALLLRDAGVAEEVVQDSFVAMHGRWRRLRDPDNGLAYLRQTVVNRSRSALRHRTVVARHDAARPQTAPGADDDVLLKERRADMIEALRGLPRRQRETLVLRYYLDLSEAEIATTLDISRGAVKSHASRGLAALRTTMEH